MKYIMSIDQGTTSSRAILFDERGRQCGVSQREFPQFFPNDGWVEQDANEIWTSTVEVVQELMKRNALSSGDLIAFGITNQRETTVVWDRATGEPLHRAVVWQDRRTADWCESQSGSPFADLVTERTGLLVDPYFSATKLAWILNNEAGLRERAKRGEVVFGTIDAYLLFRLTGGKVHLTDATNASRTMLYDIHRGVWDEQILSTLNIPIEMMPEVCDCAHEFGVTGLFGGAVPIRGMAGDQQAALIGQGCFTKGDIKSTYGTGCFVIVNTGDDPLRSENRLLSTVAYQLEGHTTYGLEGSIFVAGAAVQWLRDELRLIASAHETEQLVSDAGGVYLVPAFTGLGAPYWDPNARGALTGLTRDSGVSEIVTATLQSVGYQTRDLIDAMVADGVSVSTVRVDGGMVVNNWVVQFIADILRKPLQRPVVTETTALGAALLAGLQSGVFAHLDMVSELWQLDRSFSPAMPEDQSERLYEGWKDAVRRVRSNV
ncbi:MAG: glycerol kinase [Gammaproteobacteria bacterium]|nr:glycerol kinase [Gammaproteobacteria bacterium]OUU07054.1 MAG: glycerol kinase [Gammaproteobacteria bacterium TMED34]